MTDVAAAGELFARYAFTMDTKAIDDLASILTDDAVFSLEIAGLEAPPAVEGAAAIVEFIRSTAGSDPAQLRHVITNVRADGDAIASYLTLFATVDGALETRTTALYTCEVAEVDGALRFRRIHVAFDRPF